MARLKARRQHAMTERDQIKPLIDDVFDYCIPYRRSTRTTGKGDRRVNEIFDHTAIEAAHRFAGKFQQDMWAPGEENFSLEPGRIVTDPRQRDQLNQILAPIQAVAQSFFDASWDTAFHEMAFDLVAGTGAILMNPAPMDEPRLWDPMAVPIDDIALDCGPSGRVTGIFWDREMTIRQLAEDFGEDKLGPALKEMFRAKGEEKITVHVDTVREKTAQGWRWKITAWCDKQDAPLRDDQSITCPWIVPRYYKVAGEAWGRGIGMIATPTIKTVNTAARLQLAAAAIALMGIFTAVDDGVFNPDLALVEPGAIWKVARNGGVLGPSVNRLPDPRIDLSNIILQDLRMGIKSVMLDQQLPPDTGAVRSPTEILARVKQLAADYAGAFGRLVEEIHVPAASRAIELAFNRGLVQLPDGFTIDQLLVRLSVRSPVAIAREAGKLQRIMQWLEMLITTGGMLQEPGLPRRMAKIEDMLSEARSALNVDMRFATTAEERAQIDQQQQEQAAAMAAMAAAAGAAGGEMPA